tara:strand:- start:6060 stop:7334 length:1275 start_codon:yes stop_codon:yes gene_type:complete
MLICRMLRNTLLAGLAALFVLSAAAAQDVQKIVAVVNDEVISGYDLNQRIKLTIILSGFPNTDRTRQQLVDPTLARLIDDRLKMQEAARYNISISDEEVLNAIAYLEETNGMPPGQLDRMLRQNNIDIDTMMSQVRANLIWNRLIEARIMPRITISDEEVEAVRQAMEANKGKTEYLMSEIYLPIEPSAPEAQVRDSVANLVSQLRSGASFERAASQFSQGATAASGGSIGWVLEEDVEPEIAELLPNLGTNRISDPIRSGAGFYIVTVKATRKILENDPDDISLDITQIVVPEPAEGAANAGPGAQEKLANTISNFIDGCEKLPDILTELNSSLSGRIGQIRLGDMPDHIKEILQDMETGEVSTPYFDDGVYRIFVVCERNDPQARSNDPDAIRREIMLRRAENRARGYMQDIHTAATVENRL